jgi:hypothetical protein
LWRLFRLKSIIGTFCELVDEGAFYVWEVYEVYHGTLSEGGSAVKSTSRILNGRKVCGGLAEAGIGIGWLVHRDVERWDSCGRGRGTYSPPRVP